MPKIHVWPINDLREHRLEEDGVCWCNPIEDEEEPNVIVHNSMDGREDYENGKRKLS